MLASCWSTLDKFDQDLADHDLFGPNFAKLWSASNELWPDTEPSFVEHCQTPWSNLAKPISVNIFVDLGPNFSPWSTAFRRLLGICSAASGQLGSSPGSPGAYLSGTSGVQLFSTTFGGLYLFCHSQPLQDRRHNTSKSSRSSSSSAGAHALLPHFRLSMDGGRDGGCGQLRCSCGRAPQWRLHVPLPGIDNRRRRLSRMLRSREGLPELGPASCGPQRAQKEMDRPIAHLAEVSLRARENTNAARGRRCREAGRRLCCRRSMRLRPLPLRKQKHLQRFPLGRRHR